MAPIVVPNVVRYSLIHSLYNQDVVNVMDVEIVAPDRVQAAQFVSQAMIDSWVEDVMPLLSQSLAFLNVTWVDLNSLDGFTGSNSLGNTATLPVNGTGSDNALPGNTCVRVRKVIAGANRRERSGTVRLAGIPESYSVAGQGNTLSTQAISGFNTGMNAFLASFETSLNEGDATPCVVHTVAGVGTGSSPIQIFSTQGILGTQRRRMPGYGT